MAHCRYYIQLNYTFIIQITEKHDRNFNEFLRLVISFIYNTHYKGAHQEPYLLHAPQTRTTARKCTKSMHVAFKLSSSRLHIIVLTLQQHKGTETTQQKKRYV